MLLADVGTNPATVTRVMPLTSVCRYLERIGRAERFVLGFGRRGAGALLAQAPTLPERVAQFEADAITSALRECNGSTAEAADRLGLPRRTLNEKIARYGLRDHAD